MPRKIPSDAELKAFAEEHLAYEVNMLLGSAHVLVQPNNPQFLTNAFVECFTIHLRTLVDFLWEPARRADDAIAQDFFISANAWENIRPIFPVDLEPVRGRTGKEIAHLTYARVVITPETKKWNVTRMTEAIVPVIRLFIANADKARIGNALATL